MQVRAATQLYTWAGLTSPKYLTVLCYDPTLPVGSTVVQFGPEGQGDGLSGVVEFDDDNSRLKQDLDSIAQPLLQELNDLAARPSLDSEASSADPELSEPEDEEARSTDDEAAADDDGDNLDGDNDGGDEAHGEYPSWVAPYYTNLVTAAVSKHLSKPKQKYAPPSSARSCHSGPAAVACS